MTKPIGFAGLRLSVHPPINDADRPGSADSSAQHDLGRRESVAGETLDAAVTDFPPLRGHIPLANPEIKLFVLWYGFAWCARGGLRPGSCRAKEQRREPQPLKDASAHFVATSFRFRFMRRRTNASLSAGAHAFSAYPHSSVIVWPGEPATGAACAPKTSTHQYRNPPSAPPFRRSCGPRPSSSSARPRCRSPAPPASLP